jgi:hypothetical protein
MSDRPTRRDLLRPVQLLGIAFACAVFAGGVTFMTAGGFQPAVGAASALPLTGIVAGIIFIVVLLGLSLLLLAVDPAEIERPIDRPVLLPDEDDRPPASGPEA